MAKDEWGNLISSSNNPFRIDVSLLKDDKKLKEIFEKLVKRSRQDFLNSTEERWKIYVDRIAERIQRRFWREIQPNIDWNWPEPILYPENTRLFYTKGQTAILFIEQKPMVRTIRLACGLVMPNASSQTSYSFTLSFPYIVYVFKFFQGKFETAQIFFQNAPLSGLGDKPLLPALSNTKPKIGNICFGEILQGGVGEPYDYSTQTSKVLDAYWNSEFTTDWRDNYDWGLAVDSRMNTPRKWSEESKKNPMFVLSVKWPDTKFETYREILTKNFSSDSKVRQFKKSIYDNIMEEEIQNVFNDFRNNNPDPATVESRINSLSSQFIVHIRELLENS